MYNFSCCNLWERNSMIVICWLFFYIIVLYVAKNLSAFMRGYMLLVAVFVCHLYFANCKEVLCKALETYSKLNKKSKL